MTGVLLGHAITKGKSNDKILVFPFSYGKPNTGMSNLAQGGNPNNGIQVMDMQSVTTSNKPLVNGNIGEMLSGLTGTGSTQTTHTNPESSNHPSNGSPMMNQLNPSAINSPQTNQMIQTNQPLGVSVSSSAMTTSSMSSMNNQIKSNNGSPAANIQSQTYPTNNNNMPLMMPTPTSTSIADKPNMQSQAIPPPPTMSVGYQTMQQMQAINNRLTGMSSRGTTQYINDNSNNSGSPSMTNNDANVMNTNQGNYNMGMNSGVGINNGNGVSNGNGMNSGANMYSGVNGVGGQTTGSNNGGVLMNTAHQQPNRGSVSNTGMGIGNGQQYQTSTGAGVNVQIGTGTGMGLHNSGMSNGVTDGNTINNGGGMPTNMPVSSSGGVDSYNNNRRQVNSMGSAQGNGGSMQNMNYNNNNNNINNNNYNSPVMRQSDNRMQPMMGSNMGRDYSRDGSEDMDMSNNMGNYGIRMTNMLPMDNDVGMDMIYIPDSSDTKTDKQIVKPNKPLSTYRSYKY